VPLVWVTGVSGSGKSSVCEMLTSQGRMAVDADWEGLSRWVHRVTGEPVAKPPYPVPQGWLDEFAWMVRPDAVERLAAGLGSRACFLGVGFENEAEVRQSSTASCASSWAKRRCGIDSSAGRPTCSEDTLRSCVPPQDWNSGGGSCTAASQALPYSRTAISHETAMPTPIGGLASTGL
jgi:hypothetical protein